MKNDYQSYVKSYLEFIADELNYSKKTVETYNIVLKKYGEFIKNNNFLKVDIETSSKYKAFLISSNLDNKTSSLHLSAVRSFYNYLLEIKIIDTNPYLNLKNPKVPKKLPNFLNESESNKIIIKDNFKNDLDVRNALIIEFLYATGLRVSEMVSIKIEDINSDGTIKVMGKGSKERIVFYNACNQDLWGFYLNNSRNNILKGTTSEYLFVSASGKSLTVRTVENIVARYARESGVKSKVTPHTLRHTYATDLLNNGADIRSVGELLGHSSLSTTGIYTHVTSSALKKAYKNAHPRGKIKK